METIWFCLVAVMIAVYVVLDGFDLGAGIIHLFVARTDSERRAVLGSIGPVWDGNEVWLLAGGGTLYFAFPALYASSFSGFYLPLMIVLWLLILRGISIEFRNHIQSPVWQPLWDVVFAGASALLAIFFGAALGNVVRGVPLDASGEFFLPLWTDFTVGMDTGILDWYTILIAVAALLTLIGDGVKGWAAVYLAGRVGAAVGAADWVVAAAALAVFLGHLYPVFHQFAGGKGVSTAAGIVYALHWQLGLALMVVWLASVASTIASIWACRSLPRRDAGSMVAGSVPVFFLYISTACCRTT